jgi:predicted protein tyrosine phosphatase
MFSEDPESGRSRHNSIEVTGFSRAKRIKRRGFSGVITIEDPICPRRRQMRFNRHPHPSHLVLRFEDLDSAVTGIRTPTREDVIAAINFSKEVEGPLLIHCYAGISRSTGIALAIIAERMGRGREGEALSELLNVRPPAVPNMMVVEHADEILDRNGRLLQTLKSWDETLGDNRARRILNREAVLREYGLDSFSRSSS